MNKLYVLEGADGTGKSTLAKELLEQTKGHLLHASFDKEWDIQKYHTELFEVALTLVQYQDVILDRWAVSEEVYAEAYRGGKNYSADDFVLDLVNKSDIDIGDVKFVYCSNGSIVENHETNKSVRGEMFDDISPVVREYEKYMGRTTLEWIKYDFTIEGNDLNKFVKEIKA